MTRTRQEIFDIAWNGLKAQGFARSAVENEYGCLYRGPNGLRCAIGHCISDEEYREVFEGTGISTDNGYSLRKAARISTDDLGFAGDLQAAHDENPAPDAMKEALLDLALRYSLTVPSEPVAP